MKIVIRGGAVDALKDKGFQEIDSFLRYHGAGEPLKLDIVSLSTKQIDLLSKAILAHKDLPGHKAALDAIKLWADIQKNPKNAKCWSLEQTVSVMKQYISTSPRYMLFYQSESGIMFPYVVYEIEFVKARGRNPAHVNIKMKCYKKGANHDREITIYGKEAKESNCQDVLTKRNYSLATQALLDSYDADVIEYRRLRNAVGKQVVGTGPAEVCSKDYWGSGTIMLEVDGKKSRLVIDNIDESDNNPSRWRAQKTEDEAPTTDGSFWDMKRKIGDDSTSDDGTDEVLDIPLHPVVLAFNLEKHQQVWVHTKQLEDYVYDKEVGSKLVLPDFQVDLINLLMQHDRAEFKDIISGKSGGSIVLCSGVPGTGKTLTAEVFSEKMERPLYKVQSSQLGTTATTLETELQTVLARATRWGAILLIDEADVFIHERGNDINQNAVVGVFLRVLEYYQGILFLTTNRDTLIDDAIVSRCTAKVNFQVPTVDQQKRIWEILAICSNVKIKASQIASFAAKHPHIVGRDVKGLIKLAHIIATQRKEPITCELIEYVMQFKPTHKDSK